MLSGIQGQPGAISLLENMLEGPKTAGRTILLQGERGTGKFSAAVGFAREALGTNPYFSADFTFYRNDDYELKTRYFLKNLKNPAIRALAPEYFSRVLGRLSQASALGEIGKSTLKFKKPASFKTESYGLTDFQTDLERVLSADDPVAALDGEGAVLRDNLLAVSGEISKKKRIPIDFIRSVIDFHSLKSAAGRRITVIGDFENATEEAQNAALKLFEEPAPGSFILLTSPEPETLLPTILSRCVRINFQVLSPRVLQNILGQAVPERFHSTTNVLEDAVHQYSKKARGKVLEFFTDIAPRIQHENRVFAFIESLAESDSLPLCFLDELSEFLRCVFLVRESRLRHADYTDFVNREYLGICSQVSELSRAAELSELSRSIADAARGIRHNNLTDTVILPNILIDTARWFQKRRKSGA